MAPNMLVEELADNVDDNVDDNEDNYEDKSDNELDAQQALDHSTFNIYIPTFLLQYELSSLSYEEQNRQLLQKDWLTRGLTQEIEALYPTAAEIKKEDDNKRDPAAFQQKISKLFPSGRIFASFKQLDQAADMFLGAWAVKKTNHSKSISCSYSATHNLKSRKHLDPTLRRKLDTSLKDIYKCPFKIRYSFVAYSKNKALKKPDILYKVKITTVNFVHTCQLTTIFHRQALQKGGGCQPDLNGLNDIVSLLKHKPNLQCEFLRPLLAKYLPFYNARDAQFLVNFRSRVNMFVLNHGDKELTMEDARKLSSKRSLASDEFLLNDNPMQKQNLTDLLRKVMQEGSSTWDSLRFLQELKKSNPGFDYRVNYNDYGRPEGVCWMLPEMRSDLLRFGNILFLDSQKRQYNTVGWPYIGPVVKDSEMQVRCVAESICVEESHRMYVWITQMLAEMEPRFQLLSIKIIFGDQALTQQILVDLGIQDTCILRGDYHHLINEVWPATFGPHLYHNIRRDLEQMLIGSRKEWEEGYSSAKKHLLHDADKFSSLDQIYNDPSHYAGWFLRKIEGNLFLNGSVPAEQNHSSVSAHLGAGGTWSVAEQLKKLLERQTHLTTKRRSKDQKAYVIATKYKSSLRDQNAFDDETAKKQLSTWAYAQLFQKAFKYSRKLLCKVEGDETFVWPHGKQKDCEQLIVITNGNRCPCHRRIGYRFQCSHELKMDGKLDLGKYHSRWLNQRTFNHTMHSADFQMPLDDHSSNQQETNPLFLQDNSQDQKFNADDSSLIGDHDTCNLDDDDAPQYDSDAEMVTLASLGANTSKDVAKLTYQFVAEKASNLVRLAQSDQTKLGALCQLIDQLTHRLRSGLNIDVVSFDLSIPANDENLPNRPVLGTLRPAPNVISKKRLISRHEARRAHASKNRKLSPIGDGHSNDFAVCPAPRVQNKTCTICKCPGHKRGSCPKIHKYKKAPLEMGRNGQSRLDLSNSLSKPGRYKTYHRPEEDVRVVSISLPKLVTGIVIHQRLFLNRNTQKMVLECTFLVSLAEEHSTFQKSLFNIDVISIFVNRSKSQVIVCELEDDSPDGYESMGYPTTLSQTTPQYHSQTTPAYLSQTPAFISLPNHPMGYGFVPPSTSDTMGYGISGFETGSNL
jgi:hypothetical protein